MKRDKILGVMFAVLAAFFLTLLIYNVVDTAGGGEFNLMAPTIFAVFFAFFFFCGLGSFLMVRAAARHKKRAGDAAMCSATEKIYTYPHGKTYVVFSLIFAVYFHVAAFMLPWTTMDIIQAVGYSVIYLMLALSLIAQGWWRTVVISDGGITYRGKIRKTEDVFITQHSTVYLKRRHFLILGDKYYTQEEINRGAYRKTGFRFWIRESYRLEIILKRYPKKIEIRTPSDQDDEVLTLINEHNAKFDTADGGEADI